MIIILIRLARPTLFCSTYCNIEYMQLGPPLSCGGREWESDTLYSEL